MTHIMGPLAFTSQLLCEQVTGRGVRQVSYELDADGRFSPKYANDSCLLLSIVENIGEGSEAPPPPRPSVQFEVVPGRNQYETGRPNAARVEAVLRPTLVIDWDTVESSTLDPMQTSISAELVPAEAGQTDLSKIGEIDSEKAVEEFRLQNLIVGLSASRIFRTRTRFLNTNSTYRCN